MSIPQIYKGTVLTSESRDRFYKDYPSMEEHDITVFAFDDNLEKKREFLRNIHEKFKSGEKIWVQLLYHNTYPSAIGYLTDFDPNFEPASMRHNIFYAAKANLGSNRVVYLYPYDYVVSFLADYTGSTVSLTPKEMEKSITPIPIYDKLGHEIKEGDMVSYINGPSGGMIQLGIVQKIFSKRPSRTYQEWYKNRINPLATMVSIKAIVDSGTKSGICNIHDIHTSRTILVLEPGIEQRAMMAKLKETKQ